MPFNELFQGNGHLFFHRAGVVDMARNVEELRARVSLSAETQKPRAATTADGWCHSYCLNVGNGCWTAKHACNKTMLHYNWSYSMTFLSGHVY